MSAAVDVEVAAEPRGPGLTPPAAVLVTLGLALLGGAADALTGQGLRVAFAVCFVAGCLLGAVLVRRRGLRAVVVAPPLVYACVALVSGMTRGRGVPRTASRQFLQLVTELVLGAPVLLAGTLVAVVVVVVRAVQHR